ncbi:g7596 [Coccomyxa viridis]|uniref:G7596 protein n=1 Tax=Coccomyxa viridis TaxID=1274662 RepID=A0ABP1G0N9_9CHLO
MQNICLIVTLRFLSYRCKPPKPCSARAFTRHIRLLLTTLLLFGAQAEFQESYNQNAELAAEFSEYKNETTALINSLVVEVNSLTPGYNGTNGLNGINGTTGAKGPTGQSGLTGETGGTGTTGATGQTGQTGLMGNTGASGKTGTTGSTGQSGQTGTTGASGMKGATGLTGQSGLTGTTGGTGTTGATGLTGQNGLTGTRGGTGTAGATGLTGQTGLTGTTGASGATGFTGATGCTGFQSVQLTTLGNFGPNGPTSVSGYGTDGACALIAASTPAGVQRFTVLATGTYRLDVAGASTSTNDNRSLATRAILSGLVPFQGGTYLYAAIGQQPNMRQPGSFGPGGSGGTFVYSSS